ncbi:hypothetical protein [Pedobacter sp. V48]|uniref:hypothetical protein n=1 Tax=Pedobacter sp. V48 TaxID=509635 RepID=UPI0003E53181|nr:hypothetical protein [Pedobacter sp. V48]ETZ20964.1 hypothetical protein N824_02305 [Pedobacter sp. V48]
MVLIDGLHEYLRLFVKYQVTFLGIFDAVIHTAGIHRVDKNKLTQKGIDLLPLKDSKGRKQRD